MTKRVKDIGSVEERLLICGGAYSNRHALEALLAEASRLGIAADHILHSGDVVAYCGEPDACAKLLRASGAQAIPGNVEEQLAQNAQDCACGFAAGSTCDRLAQSWYELADRRVGVELRGWMGALPDFIAFTMGGLRFFVLHGGVTRINRFIYETDSEDVFLEEMEAAGSDAIIAGHSGLPFTRQIGGRLWHNSGALGLPANDGTRDGWYSLLTPLADGGVEIEHRRLRYDARAAAGVMRAAGLPDDYARTLETGIYPQDNSLPPEMAARAGQRISLSRPIRWQPAGAGQALAGVA